jgi:hypothetical protein
MYLKQDNKNAIWFMFLFISQSRSLYNVSVAKLNASVTSLLSAGTSWLTAKHYKIFRICSSGKINQMRVSFIVMHWLKKKVTEINPAGQVRWLQSLNYCCLPWLKSKQHHRFCCCSFQGAHVLCEASQWYLWCVF